MLCVVCKMILTINNKM